MAALFEEQSGHFPLPDIKSSSIIRQVIGEKHIYDFFILSKYNFV